MSRDYAIAQTLATGTTDWLKSLIAPEPWTQDALCAQTDPEAFFPDKGGSTADAKQICLSCDVVDQCLEYAMRTNQRDGIWGGKSAIQRARMRKTNA